MEPETFSRTALMAALIRAIHAKHHSPKIFEDPFAAQLLNDDDREFCESVMLNALEEHAPSVDIDAIGRDVVLTKVVSMVGASANALSRARYAEDILQELLSEGIKQYILLGAGLDTFALRTAIQPKDLIVFEVDHPPTQTFKKNRIVAAGFEIPPCVQFVPCDFTNTRIDEALSANEKFSKQVRSFFNWMGVTYYLSRTTIVDTLHAIRCVSSGGSSLVLDFIDSDAFDPDKLSERAKPIVATVASLGEPLLSVLSATSLDKDLSECGFRLRELLSPVEIQTRYFVGRADGMCAAEHINYAWLTAD